MMLTISLTKWQQNSSGLWASALAEGSSWRSGALPLFSAPSHGNAKGSCENTHFGEGSAILQPYFTPAVALGPTFLTSNPYCCIIRSKQSSRAGAEGCAITKRQKSPQRGCWLRRGLIPIFVFASRCCHGGCSLEGIFSIFWSGYFQPMETGLEASQGGRGFTSAELGRRLDVFQCSCLGRKVCSRVFQSSCRAGCCNKTSTNWSRAAGSNCSVWPLSAKEKGDAKEMLTSGFWGNIFLNTGKPPWLIAWAVVQHL